MSKKRYIRLTTEYMNWTGKVAELVREEVMGPNSTQIYVFKDVGGSMMGLDHIITANEAEFITKKEYFTEVLKGKIFGG